MASKVKKRKKPTKCWEGYSHKWHGKAHFKKGKDGDRVRDCRSKEEIAAMSKKKS